MPQARAAVVLQHFAYASVECPDMQPAFSLRTSNWNEVLEQTTTACTPALRCGTLQSRGELWQIGTPALRIVDASVYVFDGCVAVRGASGRGATQICAAVSCKCDRSEWARRDNLTTTMRTNPRRFRGNTRHCLTRHAN
ncbi:unnamed protein product [Spodoptera exigua]|nr:unnamed protein product [Spodoptera exigua]